MRKLLMLVLVVALSIACSGCQITTTHTDQGNFRSFEGNFLVLRVERVIVPEDCK